LPRTSSDSLVKVLVLGGLIGALVVGASLGGLLETPDLRVLDAFFALRGSRPPVTPIIVVTIDEDSFDELDLPWPWPRALHARFLDIVNRGQPAAVGFDVLFAEPSARGPDDDRPLADAIARAGNVVLAGARTVVQTDFITKADLKPPIGSIRAGAAGFGPVNYDIDRDGSVRWASLEYQLGDRRFGGFVRHLYDVGRNAGLPTALRAQSDTFMINYRGGPRTFPWIPYYRVLNGEVSPETFRGKIVLVGATTPVLHDMFSTPFAPAASMPGVEIHANALETLFRGFPIRPAPPAVGMAISFLAAVLAVWLTRRLRPLRALILLPVIGLAGWAAGFGLFVIGHVWAVSVGPTLALAAGYSATVVVEFLREQRERRRLSRFFSPAVLREIVRHKNDLNLGSSRRVVTVLFADIRGFTSIAERLEPEQVAEVLREYLTELTAIVFRHGGTVDKYVGDSIMALYNAPFEQSGHAAQAVRTASAFQEATELLSARWQATLGIPIRTAIGINTGEAVVGTLGSRQRLEYTAIGDTINLASRFESVAKKYREPIIIGDATYALVKEEFPTRALGRVRVRGKALPVRVYAIAIPQAHRTERGSAGGPSRRRRPGAAGIPRLPLAASRGATVKRVEAAAAPVPRRLGSREVGPTR
jgi:adenylate cyclase